MKPAAGSGAFTRKPKIMEDEPPPVLGTWARVYVFVLCGLVAVIGVFYWFTAAFRP